MERVEADRRPATGRVARRARQQQIRDLVAGGRIGSQQQLAELLAERGFGVTQATVSRDIAELGLVKVSSGEGHVYAASTMLAAAPAADDRLLRRVLDDLPVQVRRSGLILVLVSSPGSASVIAEAIDRSTLVDQVGTLAGDNTVLVLFGDEAALVRWRDRFAELQEAAAGGLAPQGGQR